MAANFFIPEKIKVGFQNRSDTYTGKLGYVIYYDNKGVLRKEASWSSWRDNSIDPLELNNTPISGFMLNRHAGGERCGWNHRQSYCRVWDPRGFEFEITIDNLLWILEYCDCVKGKTLVGNFVYSWSGTDLILLPENTEEYKESSIISRKKVSKKLKLEDLNEGYLYKLKYPLFNRSYSGGDEFIFIGRVKSQVNLGRNYKNIYLFSNKSLNRFFPIDLSKIDYEIGPCLEKDRVDEILYRFSISAYSWNFWNTSEGFIQKLDFLDKGPKEVKISSLISNNSTIDYSFSNTLEVNQSVINNPSCDEFDYYQPYIKVNQVSKSSYYGSYFSNTIKMLDFLSKRFKLVDGRLELVKDYMTLGQVDKLLLKDLNRYMTNVDFSLNKIYPNVNDEILKNLKNQEDYIQRELGFNGKKKRIIYTTLDGYTSDSLQIVLSKGGMIDGLFNNLFSFTLPEKL